jgi:serine/threonine-protein kinase RsbW
MKMIKLKVPSQFESIASIEKALGYIKTEYEKNSLGKTFPLNPIKVAIYEAFSNAIKHAHMDQSEKDIIIQLILEAQRIEVRVLDCGKGFDFEKMKALSQTKVNFLSSQTVSGSVPEIGLGIFVITSLMDHVSYIPATRNTPYNRMIMVKNL